MSNRKTKQADRAALRELDDQTLDTLLALRTIVGTRRTWPGWAYAALAADEPDARSRRAFRRLLRRTWPRAAHWQTRDALRVIATALGVDLPAQPAPPARAPRVRTRWAAHGPAPAPDRSPCTLTNGAAGTPAAEPAPADAAADAAAQERARRHNNRPGVWQPAASVAEALHGDNDIGWQ